VPVGDEASARAQVEAGDLDVALVPDDAAGSGGYRAITQDEVSPDLRPVLDTAVAQQGLDAALRDEGVDPGQLAAATAGAVVTVDAIDPPDPDAGQRTALAYVSVLLLYLQLLGNGIAVSTSVVEEKTSRVVELLLSTIKPLHLLVGKIIGIGLVGLLQLAVLGGVGLAAALATGLITLTGTAVAVFVGTLGWFVLGYAFFATLYAAAGSLVSRQEDVGSVTAPLTILVVAMFLVAQTSLQDPGGTVATVLSWVPPFSAILMPLRIAAGVTGPAQVVGTVVLMVLATALLGALAAKVYPRSILRTGAKVSWKQALGRG
jgi:ABC-2 type transport system permease protein